MTPSFATIIAEAASSAFRGFGTTQPIVAAWSTGRLAPPPPWLGNRPPAIDLVLVKIELNFHR